MPPQNLWNAAILLRLAVVLAMGVGGCSRVATVFTPEKPNSFMEKPIVIGQGVGELEVGKITMGEVIALLGDKFERSELQGSMGGKCVDGVCDNNFQKFTDINLDYSKYGLMLGFRAMEGQSAPESDLKLRFIYITCARKGSGCRFTGQTSSGVHLGSKRKDVEAAVGKSDTWTGRQGMICKRSGVNIRFTITGGRIGEDDPVESFELFSSENFNEFEHRSI